MEPTFYTEAKREEFPDLAAEKRKVLADLEGLAWQIGAASQPIPDRWVTFPLTNNGIAAIDPKRIGFDRLKPLALRGEDLNARHEKVMALTTSWQYIGRMQGQSADLFITPRISELQYKRLPGVRPVEDNADLVEKLQIGTLEFRAIPVTPSDILEVHYFMPPEINWSTTALLAMSRTDAPNGANQQRNPEIAETGFLREFKLGLRQLRAIGFSHAIGHPSDHRRARIYEKIGMEIAINEVGDDYTWLDLNHLPNRLRS